MKLLQQHKNGQIEVVEIDDDDIPDDECRKLVELPSLGVYEFEALTGFPMGDDDAFVFDLAGVRLADYSAGELAMLAPTERMEITEALRHRLDFPCSPRQLVDFVADTSWVFSLPQAFIESVEGAAERVPNMPLEQLAQKQNAVDQTKLSHFYYLANLVRENPSANAKEIRRLCLKSAGEDSSPFQKIGNDFALRGKTDVPADGTFGNWMTEARKLA